MAIYRAVQVSYWQDAFVLNLTPEEKFFYIYLLTNSKTTQCGCYELPLKLAALETGYDVETIKKLIKRFEEYGKIKYSENTQEILILNWSKYNKSSSPDVQKCIEKEIKNIKNERFKLLLTGCGDAPKTATPDSGEKEKENNNKKKNNINAQNAQFSVFWSKYPNKKGKTRAIKIFPTVIKKIGFEKLMNAVDNYCQEIEKKQTDLRYVKHGNTFLTSGYEDFLDDNIQEQTKPRNVEPYSEANHIRFKHWDSMTEKEQFVWNSRQYYESGRHALAKQENKTVYWE